MNTLQGFCNWARHTGRGVFCSTVGILLLGMFPTAFADTQAAIKNFVAAHLHEMIDAASRSTPFQKNICTSARFGMMLTDVIPTTKTLTVDRSDHITWGTWKQGVVEDGCGTKSRFNILVTVAAPDKITMSPLLPGTTFLLPSAQDAVVKQLMMTLLNKHTPFVCDTGYVQDTAFVAFVDPAAKPSPAQKGWRETWTVAMCKGVKATMPVTFAFPPPSNNLTMSVGAIIFEGNVADLGR